MPLILQQLDDLARKEPAELVYLRPPLEFGVAGAEGESLGVGEGACDDDPPLAGACLASTPAAAPDQRDIRPDDAMSPHFFLKACRGYRIFYTDAHAGGDPREFATATNQRCSDTCTRVTDN